MNFEHTAWDLALATQALTYIDSELAFELIEMYDATLLRIDRALGQSPRR